MLESPETREQGMFGSPRSFSYSISFSERSLLARVMFVRTLRVLWVFSGTASAV